MCACIGRDAFPGAGTGLWGPGTAAWFSRELRMRSWPVRRRPMPGQAARQDWPGVGAADCRVWLPLPRCSLRCYARPGQGLPEPLAASLYLDVMISGDLAARRVRALV